MLEQPPTHPFRLRYRSLNPLVLRYRRIGLRYRSLNPLVLRYRSPAPALRYLRANGVN